MNDETTPTKVRLTDGLGAEVAARPIQWREYKRFQWEDDLYGFSLWVDDKYQRPIFVSWDRGLAAWIMRRKRKDTQQFMSYQGARAWCQRQVDDWIRRHAVAAHNAK
jgi:hypothetical protein